MKTKLVIRQLYRSERRLAHRLNGLAARHRSDHDIHNMALDLAQWSGHHLEQLTHAGRRHGLRLQTDPKISPRTAALQSQLGVVLRKRPESGLLLLADLRRVHLLAADTSVHWELLGQVAQATKDEMLLSLTQRCHPETLRQMRWANGALKELSVQVLLN